MKKMSFKEAAREILGRGDEPLTAQEIVSIALEEGLIETEGKTPDATIAALLYMDIRNNKNSPFIKIGRGKFSLKTKKASIASPIHLIEQQNQNVKKLLKEKLHEMDPYQFEYLIADLLQKIGYENVNVTKRSGDGGIDVEANLTVGGVTNVKTVIQAKRHKSNISGKVITQLRGSAEVDQRGLVITTSDFTRDARSEARAPNKMPVSLVNGNKLVEMLFKYEVGVKKEEKVIYEIDIDYFENVDIQEGKPYISDKNRSIWPLPGGIHNYIETLNQFLAAIEKGTNKKKDLIKWYINNFEKVGSQNTAFSYINVPKNMRLIDVKNGVYYLTDVKNGVYYLTEVGKKYLELNDDPDYLYEVISDNILAFSDIVEFLKTSKEPKNEQEILDYLKDNFDIGWTTFAQVNFRLLWLINLGKIKKTEGGYINL